jgi:hypothetical protein
MAQKILRDLLKPNPYQPPTRSNISPEVAEQPDVDVKASKKEKSQGKKRAKVNQP